MGILAVARRMLGACALASGAALVASCAQVPRESVELSTAVGRDVAAAHESHRSLARTLFERMKRDVNRFVDDVYAPYQIQFAIDRQKKKQAQGDANNLFSVIEAGLRQPQDAQAQKDVLQVMQAFVEVVHEDIEEYRRARLAPVLEQEHEVTAAIDRLYDQIKEGNAAVTAHLASVVKVHEAQDEVLRKANLEGLREKVGRSLGETSARVSEFVDRARAVEGSVDAVSGEVDKLTGQLDSLLKGK